MSLFKTDCSGCIFNSSGKEDEVNCDLGRYDIFKSRDRTNGKYVSGFCSACRDEKWGEQFTRECCEEHEEHFEEAVYQELQSQYILVIVDEEKDGKVLERLEESLSTPQTIKPSKVIVFYEGEDSMSDIIDLLQSKKYNYGCRRVFFQDYKNEILDLAIESAKGIFFFIQRNGKKLNPNCFKAVFTNVEEKLNNIILVRPLDESNHGLACLFLYHKAKGGFQNGNLIDTEDENAYALMTDWGTLLNEDNSSDS